MGAIFAAALPCQSVAVETVKLDNGLTVLLHRDARLPIVAIDLCYHVGAKDEPAGRSGFAHLFEHLMFMGTQRAPAGKFDAMLEAGGAENNAMTDEDRTHYFEHGPAAMLPTMLWLEADRLEDLGRAIDDEKLERQRDVVRNEIRETVENRPYGESDELVFQLMYPEGHPYHFGILGRHEDLEAATLRDVKSFFATFYVPSNLTLAIAGDFDVAAAKRLVTELFGTLPRGAEVPRRRAPDPALDGIVRRTTFDRVELPRVKMAWHSPAHYGNGDAELDLLGEVLSDGRSSRLYRRLVEHDHLAVDVAAYQDAFDLGGLFQLDVTAASGADLDALERAIDDELVKVRSGGVAEDELAPRRAAHELRQVAGLQSPAAIAAQLNAYQAAFGAADGFARDLDRYRAVTAEGVAAVARQVLVPEARMVLRVVPLAPDRQPSARDTSPPPPPDARFVPPAPTTFTLSNGIPVALWREPSLPLVTVQVQFADGDALAPPVLAGRSAMLAAMLREGAGERDGAAFASAMQRLGGTAWAGGGHEVATVGCAVLQRNLGAALDLLADQVQRPRFAADDWQRVRGLQLDALRADADDPDAIADRVGLRLLYGDTDPLAWPRGGTPATVEAMTLADVRALHARLFAPLNARLFVAGAVEVDALRAELEKRFAGWSTTPAPRPPGFGITPIAPERTALRVVCVDRPGAVQTVVRLFAPGPRFADPRRPMLQLLGTILGGTFDSRLNRLLREERGYCYGAGAAWTMTPATGRFAFWTSVRTDVTGAALNDLFAELARLRGPDGGDITAAEVDRARAAAATAVITAFSTQSALVGYAGELAHNGMTAAALATELAALPTITAAQLNALAPTAIPLERAVLVLVGDAAAIQVQLPAAGLPAAEVVDARM
ncbi:MAG: pitrilysin family protein [Planctomycetota bacterium]